MSREITRPKKPVRRGLKINGVDFVVTIDLDGLIKARALGHQKTYTRHLAEIFPQLMREHGLVPAAPANLFGHTLPATRLYDGRSH